LAGKIADKEFLHSTGAIPHEAGQAQPKPYRRTCSHLIIFFFLSPHFKVVSPTFAVLSQTTGSGVPFGDLYISGFSRILLKK
jgi:hypothetical protein